MIRKNKLTKRTTKTEKNEKSWKILKIYNIINFKTIRYELTASGNLIDSILKYKLMRLVNTVRVPKEKKQRQKEQNQKKLSKKIIEANRQWIFQ